MLNNNMHTYRIILTQEPEGGYTVIVPSLSGCITYGDNVNHAIDMAKEAIEGYLEVLCFTTNFQNRFEHY